MGGGGESGRIRHTVFASWRSSISISSSCDDGPYRRSALRSTAMGSADSAFNLRKKLIRL